MQNVFFRNNGPYSQNEIENVSFESRQEKKALIRRQYDAMFAFSMDR